MGNTIEKEVENTAPVKSCTLNSDINELVSKIVNTPGSSLSTDAIMHISCIDLPKTDKHSKTDPFVIFYMLNKLNWEKIASTEVIQNTQNPQFVKTINTKFYFEEKQSIKFEVYDQDDPDLSNLTKQEFIGSVETTLGEIFSCKGKEYDINGHTKKGKLKVISEVAKKCKTNAIIKAILCKAGTFLSISKKQINPLPVYKSEVSKSSRQVLKPIKLNCSVICDGDNSQPIVFEVFQYKQNGDHIKLSSIEYSLSQLIETTPPGQYLELQNVKIEEANTFLDYVLAGYSISLSIGIDFTASNLPPSNPNSLHTLNFSK